MPNSIPTSDANPPPPSDPTAEPPLLTIVISSPGRAAADDQNHRKPVLSRSDSDREQCRVCQQQTEEPLIDLGCRCRGELAKAHRSCIDTWFRSRGSNKCEICQQMAANVQCPVSQPSGCFSPLGVAFSILVGGLLLDVLIAVSLGVSALPVNIIIGIEQHLSKNLFQMSSSSSSELFNDEENFQDNLVDSQIGSIALNGVRNIRMLAAPIIPLLLEAEEDSNIYHHKGSIPGRRTFSRQREDANERIWSDYFAENAKYPLNYFRRRFRMRRCLYLRILNDIENHDLYFKQRPDASGRKGLTGLQKMTAAIKMLATGCSADNLDEYIQIGESTAIESLKRFCSSVIRLYEDQYMRSPNKTDMERLLSQGEARGFPGMLGSLDCMHWAWKNCPTAWHGTHAGGSHKSPTLILEAVADKDLWIWHAFFGMSGTHNDINVLDRSHLFDDIINDKAPDCSYVVNGHQYSMGYYLTDGIYPRYATLIQTISQPLGPKLCLFAKVQEAVRKDVERAFGVLQARFAIVKGPARMWKPKDLHNVMKTCIILHNMIVEDEREEDIEPWQPPTNEAQHTIEMERDEDLLTAALIAKLTKVRDTSLHDRLKKDLIEHIWSQHGNREIM